MTDKIKEIALDELDRFIQSTYQGYVRDGILLEEAKNFVNKELTEFPDSNIEDILHDYLIEVVEEWVYDAFIDDMRQTIHTIIDEITNLLFVKFIDEIKKV